MSVLYYAMGGGLGHLTRARAVLHALGLEQQAVILTESEYAGDSRVTGDIRVLRAPGNGSYREWFRDAMVQLAPERIIVDTFPAGLFGELEARRVDYVARYLRWSAYEPRKVPQFGRTYVLEQLDDEHDRFIEQQSDDVIRDFKLGDPPAANPVVPPLPSSFVLIVHSGPADEVTELIAYARAVCSLENVTDPIVLCAPTKLHRSGVDCVDFYPAALLMFGASRIFTGGGFNAMRQFGGNPRHRPLPFPRRFDDQYRRVAGARRSARA